MMNEFDIDTDDMGTLVFCISENKWRGSDTFNSEGLCNTGSDLYSFKDGELWQHNLQGGVQNNFYGEEVVSAIGVVCNPELGKIKTWQTVSVEAAQAPSNVTMQTISPVAQESKLRAKRFSRREGVYYSEILRAGAGQKLFTGERMRGPFMLVLFEFTTTQNIQLRYMNLGYRLSSGHEFV